MEFRLHLWSSLAGLSALIGISLFFLFDLIALRDPKALTVSQEIREFLKWGWESYLIVFGLPLLVFVWYVAHVINRESP